MIKSATNLRCHINLITKDKIGKLLKIKNKIC